MYRAQRSARKTNDLKVHPETSKERYEKYERYIKKDPERYREINRYVHRNLWYLKRVTWQLSKFRKAVARYKDKKKLQMGSEAWRELMKYVVNFCYPLLTVDL